MINTPIYYTAWYYRKIHDVSTWLHSAGQKFHLLETKIFKTKTYTAVSKCFIHLICMVLKKPATSS
jgi:hypothetical protein